MEVASIFTFGGTIWVWAYILSQRLAKSRRNFFWKNDSHCEKYNFTFSVHRLGVMYQQRGIEWNSMHMHCPLVSHSSWWFRKSVLLLANQYNPIHISNPFLCKTPWFCLFVSSWLIIIICKHNTMVRLCSDISRVGANVIMRAGSHLDHGHERNLGYISITVWTGFCFSGARRVKTGFSQVTGIKEKL